jgi:glyoxylase-like metal-dependent hydrolase (beta-lactamase superfamily II)
MKLHPILLGRTKVPFGQFYGGLDGWEGLGALVRFITDKSHFIWVPIHGYLLEHPSQGLILIDTGICSEQAHQHSQYYRGIMHFILDDDEYAQEPGEALSSRLKRLGFSCNDIRTVVLTHLHEDHVGNLRNLKKARVVISQVEWDQRYIKMFGFIPMVYKPSYDFVQQWERVGFDSGPYYNFEKSQDLFGDGTVRLLPTPGHTPGHLSAVVDMNDYQLMVTGDCIYTLRHLATQQVQAIRFNRKVGDEQIDSIKKIIGLKKILPGLHLLPGHDHTNYQWKHVVPYLSKGWLTTEELHELSEYESNLFDSAWMLRPADLPRFQPDKSGGSVSEPIDPK